MKLVYGIVIAFSCTCTWFFICRAVPGSNDFNSLTEWSFAAEAQPRHFKNLIPAWQTRVGAFWLAGTLLDFFHAIPTNRTACINIVEQEGQPGAIKSVKFDVGQKFRNVFAGYFTGWLGLSFVAMICLLKEPMFVMLGTFAGAIGTAATWPDITMYPWHMSAMFFFTLAVLFWMRGWYAWMLPVILAGILFKDTVMVTAVLFLFAKTSWKWRGVYSGAAALGFLGIKAVLTRLLFGHVQLWTYLAAEGGHPNWWNNLHEILHPHWISPATIGAGVIFLAIFVLPMRTVSQRAFKSALLLYSIGVFFIGEFVAAHEFLEAMPLAMIYLQQCLNAK